MTLISSTRSLIGCLLRVLVALTVLASAARAETDAAGSVAPAVSTTTSEQAQVQPATKRHRREMTYLKREWGVEVLFVRQTSAGYMLEFRYKVLDSDKAKPLFVRRTKPVLTHIDTGAELIVPTPPKTGALRNSNQPLAGRTYWMFFANPGKLVEPGDLVTIRIGDFVAENLVVQ
jgi:hypothetical protein